jgi:hypothetical protein
MRGLLLVLLAAVATARCGSGPMTGARSDAAVQAISPSTFPETFADTYCGAIADCCGRAGKNSITCNTMAVQLMTAGMAYETEHGLVLDETVAERCLGAYAAALGACTDHALAEQIDVACWGLFRPSDVTSSRPNSALPHAELGEACTETCVGDGLTSSTCTTAGGAAPSGAVAPPTSAACWTEDGEYCANWACVPLPAVGEACGQVSYCGRDTHCQSGMCVANVPAGGKCGGSDSCLSADYCDIATLTCAPVLANGSACREDRDCAGGQCDLAVCRAWSMATDTACAGQFD